MAKFKFNYILENMEMWFSTEYNDKNKLQEEMFLEVRPFIVSIKQYNSIIKNHNIKVNMPKLNEFLLEKQAYLEWRGYNTPSLNNLKITPLFGTGFYTEISYNSDSLPSSVYNQWKVASYLLILEYNILKKALYYMENENLSLSGEYKESYFYWMNRQIDFQGFKLESQRFLIDYTIDRDSLYREVCEDYLYVLLNIILANSIINNSELKLSINNEKLFFDLLKSIIKLHYDEYKKEYICLNELRKFSSNYSLSVCQLKSIYNEVVKAKDN